MVAAEVAELYAKIKENYAGFNASLDRVKDDAKRLKDVPYETALENIERYMLTEKFPPVIADIRGGIGDHKESERAKQETQAYFSQMDRWRQSSSEPPAGYWESVKAQLRGASGNEYS